MPLKSYYAAPDTSTFFQNTEYFTEHDVDLQIDSSYHDIDMTDPTLAL